MRTTILGAKGWASVFGALLVMGVLVPVLNLLVPEGNVLHLSDFYVSLLGKILCYAICALAMDLIWGYTGILSLGHGVFFALGGYAMGMYLMRQIGRDGQYKSDMPDFMVFLNWKAKKPKTKASRPGTSSTSSIWATKLSDSAQCQGYSFQFRKTMKSGMSDLYWPSRPIWRIRYMPIA